MDAPGRSVCSLDPLALPRAVSHVGALPLILVVAAILRALPLFANYPLHHDEALYGFWARLIMSGRDPLLLTAWVDKPPLVIYALAGSLKLLGVSELALRLPGMVVSLATLVCTYGLAARIYERRTALLAAVLLAGSPFAILFAPTAFTDPWLTLWLVAAAWAALAGRSFLAGIALGLAVASKQQGILGVPLIVALLLTTGSSHTSVRPPQVSSFITYPSPFILRRVFVSLLGFALIFVPVTYWDSLRWATRPSFWDRSLTTYGGLTLAAPTLWLERAAGWVEQTGYLFGLPGLTMLMLGLALVAGVRDWRTRNAAGGVQDYGRHDGRTSPGIPPSALILAYLVGYVGLHFFVTFQPWDRYLLPLLPFICVLAARGIQVAWRWGGHAAAWPAMASDERRTTDALGDGGRLCCASRVVVVAGRDGSSAGGKRSRRVLRAGSCLGLSGSAARRRRDLSPLDRLAFRLLLVRCAAGAPLVGQRLEARR